MRNRNERHSTSIHQNPSPRRQYLIGVGMILLLATSTGVLAAGLQTFTARFLILKQVVTFDEPFTTSSSVDWINLPNAGPDGGALVSISRGGNNLIGVRFTAESRCNATGGETDVDWCLVRILMNNVEAEPQAPEGTGSFAFDSTDRGTETIGSYESHSMERYLCVPNESAQTLNIPIQVQVKVTNQDGDANAPQFWLDDWSLSIEKYGRCR